MNRTQITESREYQKIQEIVSELDRGGIIERSAGYCFGISDVIYQLLIREGIDCELVECRLTMIGRMPPSLRLVGHDEQRTQPEISTHIICIAKLAQPVIIDLSIIHLHPQVRYLIEPVTEMPKPGVLGEFDLGHSTWLYQEKPQTQAPVITNKNIIERMVTERRIKRDIQWLKIAVVVLICIASANTLRGSYDFYQTYTNDANNWGPVRPE
jgi:hypothetical protein